MSSFKTASRFKNIIVALNWSTALPISVTVVAERVGKGLAKVIMLFARKISSNNLFSYVNFAGDSKTIPDYKSGFVNEKRFAFLGFGVTRRTTFCIGEERGIHCWSCPANEIKLRTKITS